MTIGRDAPVACAAGSHSCWESFASERAALARYVSLSRDRSRRSASFEQLLDRALAGDGAARAALSETAHYIGVGIANLINGLSPEAVILGGGIARAWPLIGEGLKAAVDEYSCCRGLPSPCIDVSGLGDAHNLMGALTLVLAAKFSSALTI
jgi:predicted NBD/HSP70 family sugar kinase